jgi:hypothetical protein
VEIHFTCIHKQTTDLSETIPVIEWQHSCMSFYPTVHIIIFKSVSNLLAFSGKCNFNLLKALGISSAQRSANADKWQGFKLKFFVVAILHGQSTPLNFPPNAMGRMKKNPEFLGNT